MDFIYKNLNALITWVISFLPDSPFLMVNLYLNQIMDSSLLLRYLNWFIPMSSILIIASLWTTAITIYYLYIVILRWIKLAGGG